MKSPIDIQDRIYMNQKHSYAALSMEESIRYEEMNDALRWAIDQDEHTVCELCTKMNKNYAKLDPRRRRQYYELRWVIS